MTNNLWKNMTFTGIIVYLFQTWTVIPRFYFRDHSKEKAKNESL